MQVPHMCAAYLWFAQQISNRTKVSDTTGDTTCTSTHPIKTNKHHRVVALFCVNQTSNQILIGGVKALRMLTLVGIFSALPRLILPADHFTWLKQQIFLSLPHFIR